MRTFRQRVFLTAAITLLAATLGACVGYLLGSAITVHLAEDKLQAYAERILAAGDASSQESRNMLATVNASPFPRCSEAEVAFLRTLIFQSEYLHDAGRMHDGKIECSATLGHLSPPIFLPSPDFQQQDGIKVYRNLGPAGASEHRGLGIQQGDAYVVFGAFILNRLNAPPIHYKVSVFDAQNRQSRWVQSDVAGASEAVLRQEGRFRVNRNLFATSCSPRFFHCVTAYMSIPEALQADHWQIEFNTLVGGFTGAGFGFLFSFWYRRSQSLSRQLRRAIRQEELSVVYQPIVEISTGRIVGAEALARWSGEDGLAVPPDVFIRLAEEEQFVGEITRFVAHRTLQDFADLLRADPDLHLSINVTAMDLCDDLFLPMLESALGKAGVAAASLAIEVTESSTARSERARQTIRALRLRGHSIQIDDFGTGYSTLAYLQELEVDVIKIDRSFTQAIGTEAVTAGILPLILVMAENLHLQVVVEGVETQEQAGYFAPIKAEKPFLGQGWLYGRPMAVEDYRSLLKESRDAEFAPTL